MQLADGLEFELPSDVEEDEEIDEDMAFTAEDKIRYAGMFGDDADDAELAEEDLLASDVSEDENFADVRAWQSPVQSCRMGCCKPPLQRRNVERPCMFVTQDHSEDEAAAAGSDSDDERRHAAMLADVRAAGDGNRKRKRRDVLMSEAYPESEYNLNPASGGEAAGLRPCPCWPLRCASCRAPAPPALPVRRDYWHMGCMVTSSHFSLNTMVVSGRWRGWGAAAVGPDQGPGRQPQQAGRVPQAAGAARAAGAGRRGAPPRQRAGEPSMQLDSPKCPFRRAHVESVWGLRFVASRSLRQRR